MAGGSSKRVFTEKTFNTLKKLEICEKVILTIGYQSAERGSFGILSQNC